MARTLTAPRYPEDFKNRAADGGFYYRHWHPDVPADYDGTWPADQDPPAHAGGLWVYPHEDAVWETYEDWDRCRMVVVWEDNFEGESGPNEEVPAEEVQAAVDRVVAEVNRQGSFAPA